MIHSKGEEKLLGKQASFDIQDNLRALEDKLAHAGDQILLEEQEYQEEENIHKEVSNSFSIIYLFIIIFY